MEYPIKIDDLGVFPYFGNTQISTQQSWSQVTGKQTSHKIKDVRRGEWIAATFPPRNKAFLRDY